MIYVFHFAVKYNEFIFLPAEQRRSCLHRGIQSSHCSIWDSGKEAFLLVYKTLLSDISGFNWFVYPGFPSVGKVQEYDPLRPDDCRRPQRHLPRDQVRQGQTPLLAPQAHCRTVILFLIADLKIKIMYFTKEVLCLLFIIHVCLSWLWQWALYCRAGCSEDTKAH